MFIKISLQEYVEGILTLDQRVDGVYIKLQIMGLGCSP
jgi:hypothetical protein